VASGRSMAKATKIVTITAAGQNTHR